MLVTLALITAVLTPARPAARNAVRRWGAEGHRVIAQVALDRLTPEVAATTRRLLGGEDITDVASWADEHRRELPGTAAWHYANIETYDSSYVPARDCKQNVCIITALNNEIRILGDTTEPDSARATALKWVVHLVGDIHQPLHASDRGDRGGNDVHVEFNGRSTNLHAIWDTGLLTSFGESAPDLVHDIETTISHRSDIDQLTHSSVTQWAMESHDIARDMVYHDLPASLDITPAYADAARRVIRERLLRAGVRLAAVLNRTLKS
jgi:hypothetical protein